jgi:hypothetical protein
VIYESVIKDPECVELTVEDAGADFQAMRDLLDTRFIIGKGFFPWAIKYRKNPPTLQEFQQIKLEKDDILKIHQELKIIRNQVMRVFEILLLAIGDMKDPAFLADYKFRVQSRLNKVNRTAFRPFQKKKYPYLYIDGIFWYS